MTPIHQLLPAATPRDAITGQAFAWRDLLRTWGYESEIVAEHVDPELMGTAHTLNRAGKRLIREGALSSGTRSGALRRRWACAPTGRPRFATTTSRRESWCATSTRDWPISVTGVERPWPVFAEGLMRSSPTRPSTPPSSATQGSVTRPWFRCSWSYRRRSHAAIRNREPVVVTVGRVVPNKRLDDVIKSFALYQRRHAPEASLVIVGSDVGFEAYRNALEVLAARIGVSRVFFTGPISSEARDAWYRSADVYLSMSVHEGFCAPLIEALAHGDAGGGARCGRRARDAGRRRRRPRRR